MSEPDLAWSPAAEAWTAAETLFNFFASYEASGQDDTYEAWTTWAATDGSDDQKAIADKYSGYAFTTWLSLSGLPTIAADATMQLVFPNDPVPGWYGCGNGVCVRDTFYNNGGYCYFFWATECDSIDSGNLDPSVGHPEPATDARIHTFALTDEQFDTYISGYTVTADTGYGYEYYQGLAAAVVAGDITETTGVDYFDVPVCTDVSDTTDGTLWQCQQYQRAEDQEEDGAPRFNAPQSVTWYSIIGFVDEANFTAFKPIQYAAQQYIWASASSLAAVATTLAAASLLAF